MKRTIGLFLLLISFSASAFEIKVKKMMRDGELDRSFVLATQLEDKVVLDCQSFIQGLRIGEAESAVHFLMEPFDCESLQDRIRSSNRRRQKHCIDVEDDIRADYACN
jgi:hypothetical protein